jgi:hypothetical protein
MSIDSDLDLSPWAHRIVVFLGGWIATLVLITDIGPI